MTIAPIGAIGSSITAALAPTASPASAASASTGNFGSTLAKGVDGLQQTQANADQLAVQAATGQLTDVQDYMIASTEATLSTQLTVAVRDRAVEAFNDIMRMPV